MNDNKKSAQEYRKNAEEHLAATKSSMRTFLVVGLFVISCVAVLFALGLAWFAQNRSVTAETMVAGASDVGIELRSYGDVGVHDDILQQLLGSDGEKGFWYVDSELDHLDTSKEMPAVNWLLSDDSNIGNFNDGEMVDWSKDNNKRTDYAIEPGSSGDISFYIVPKVSGDIKVRLKLDMIPYYISEGTFHELEEDSYELDQLAGHILFFLQDGNPSQSENRPKEEISLLWIKNNEFEVSLNDVEIDNEYRYTIHWSWPQIFGEIILSDDDNYLNGRKPIFSEYKNGSDKRSEIIEDMKVTPGKYFYSSLTKQPLDTGYDELTYIEQIYGSTTDQLLQSGEAEALQAFVDLGSFYNQADQCIGKRIECVRVSLTAELESVGN